MDNNMTSSTVNTNATTKASSSSSSSTLAASTNVAADEQASSHSSRENMAYATSSPHLSTPKRSGLPDAQTLQTIRKKLSTPGNGFQFQSLQLDCQVDQSINFVKDRYVICARTKYNGSPYYGKAPSCYRHLVDMNMSNLKCTDLITAKQYQCRVINESCSKVQEAYFRLQHDKQECRSTIYGHCLIRAAEDIVPFTRRRTYVILGNALPTGLYEDLHTYLRKKHRLDEIEARPLFHQICETVLFCHRNGIILRDLKLKRFFFVDEARTKLQYESLEGSMILDDPSNDILCEKIGCPLYTAPELLCPEPFYRGKPADMWALGVILYTLLVGQYPFFEKGNNNLITIIRQCFVQLPGHLSRSARWLLLALLRKNICDRVPIEHIFLSPWLKEQRPQYMNIPVDIMIPDDDEDKPSRSSLDYLGISDEDGIQPLDYTCTALSMECGDSYAGMG